MTDLLGIGSSGVAAYRAALSATGDNVANAETPGYSRRSVRLTEAGIAAPGQGYSFQGVKVAGVQRAWDQFRAADARLAASAHGFSSARAQWLTAVETALGDPSRDVGALVTNVFTAGTGLAGNPGNVPQRAAMLAAIDEAAGGIRATAERLAQVSGGIETAATRDVEALNGELRALSEVNQNLRVAQPGDRATAALEDERDRLIDSISARIDVTTTIGEKGVATLTLTHAPGTDLITPTDRALVILQPATDGRLSLSISHSGTREPLNPMSGTLAGLVQVAASTADKRVELDTIASDFATMINDWQANGLTPAGTPGGALLTIGAGAASIRLATSDPAAIAAASATAENGNLLELPALRGDNAAESRWTALVAMQAQSLSAARQDAAAATTRRDNAFAARDEVTGIDLDREAADLIRFQQAYGASTRIIQVARETLQSILDLF